MYTRSISKGMDDANTVTHDTLVVLVVAAALVSTSGVASGDITAHDVQHTANSPRQQGLASWPTCTGTETTTGIDGPWDVLGVSLEVQVFRITKYEHVFRPTAGRCVRKAGALLSR